MKNLVTLLLIPLLALAPSCGLFSSGVQEVEVTTSEPADIYVKGKFVGTSPCTVELPRKSGGNIRAKTEDGRTAVVRVGTQVNAIFVLDIVGGVLILLPFLGLLGPGGWDLDEDAVHLILPPK